jgi:predicted DNA-binding protein (UPF0251 family)
LAVAKGDDALPRGPEEREAIKQRQDRAWHLHTIRKLTVPEVGRVLNVSERTILRDLAAARRKNLAAFRKDASKADWLMINAMEALGESNAIMRQAWTDLVSSPEGSAVRAGFLNVLLRALERRIEILQSLGLLAKAPERMLMGDLDISQLSDSELEALHAGLKAEEECLALPAGAGDPGPAESGGVDAVVPADPNQR